MPSGALQILTLPLSGWQFQVRADGWWRDLGRGEWLEDDYKDTWAPATEFFDYNCRAEGFSQDSVGWWLLYGNVPSGTTVAVTLTDGRQPPIVEFGPLWMCEWVSARQAVLLTIGDTSATVFERMPTYFAPDE